MWIVEHAFKGMNVTSYLVIEKIGLESIDSKSLPVLSAVVPAISE